LSCQPGVVAGEALLSRARTLLTDVDDAITAARSVGGELAGRMALLWEPWARASAGDADWDGIRAAAEKLLGRFAPPPGITVTPVIGGGVPALRVTRAASRQVPGGHHPAGVLAGVLRPSGPPVS
jgi:epsilon-lactone hydrolase